MDIRRPSDRTRAQRTRAQCTRTERTRPFRTLGYLAFALIGLSLLPGSSGPGPALLVGAACVWPALAWLAPRLGIGAESLCYADAALVPALGAAAGLDFWPALAVSLVVLAGLAAHGGVGLLVPGGLVALLCWSLCGGFPLAGARDMPWLAASVALLLAGFMLAIALVGHRQTRRLNQRRVDALAESSELKHANSRLARYLPEPVEALRSGGAGRQPPVQRWVTAAFVDVIGFTELVAARPLAEVADVVNDYLAQIAELVHRHGGVLGKYLGDGVLIYFPDTDAGHAPEPGARVRNAARCARLCLDLAPMLEALTRRWRARGFRACVDTRTGVASGYCAIGDWGGAGRLDYTLIGEAVNLASRLQLLAECGGILVCETTALLLEQDDALAQALDEGAEQQIRGLGSRVVYRLVDESRASAKVPAI